MPIRLNQKLVAGTYDMSKIPRSFDARMMRRQVRLQSRPRKAAELVWFEGSSKKAIDSNPSLGPFFVRETSLWYRTEARLFRSER